MIKWKQLVQFRLQDMGTRPGWCLANVREAFGITPKYADAKAAMEANKTQGTLHDTSTLPTDVAVPVFIDTPSVYEHVIVADQGTFYSDGARLTSLDGLKVFGWAETLNGVRIVEKVEVPDEPAPVPTPEPVEKPVESLVGKKVVPIKLVDTKGTKLIQYDPEYEVIEDDGETVVLKARNTIWARLAKENVKEVE